MFKACSFTGTIGKFCFTGMAIVPPFSTRPPQWPSNPQNGGCLSYEEFHLPAGIKLLDGTGPARNPRSISPPKFYGRDLNQRERGALDDFQALADNLSAPSSNSFPNWLPTKPFRTTSCEILGGRFLGPKKKTPPHPFLGGTKNRTKVSFLKKNGALGPGEELAHFPTQDGDTYCLVLSEYYGTLCFLTGQRGTQHKPTLPGGPRLGQSDHHNARRAGPFFAGSRQFRA